MVGLTISTLVAYGIVIAGIVLDAVGLYVLAICMALFEVAYQISRTRKND